MDKLSKEEVLHVAKLGRLALTEDEIDTYAYKLKDIMNSIDRIKDIKLDTPEVMIAPLTNDCVLTPDKAKDELAREEVLANAPSVYDMYIKVRGKIDD